MVNLIGYDEKTNNVYANYDHTFDIDDVYADTDALNVYRLLMREESVSRALSSYYKTGYLKRFTLFTSNKSKDVLKEEIATYTANRYAGIKQWPLFDDDYEFTETQSQAACDAFAEFLVARRMNE